MKTYYNLSINEKIYLKQCAIVVNNDKRLHFRTPVAMSYLNELQIHTLLN
jgi:hypothetical protein